MKIIITKQRKGFRLDIVVSSFKELLYEIPLIMFPMTRRNLNGGNLTKEDVEGYTDYFKKEMGIKQVVYR